MKKTDLKTSESYSLERIGDMTRMSTVLRGHIVDNRLYTNISNKNYAHVEGWQFAGGLMGLYPRVVQVENLSSGTEYKWKAEVEIVNLKTESVVSRGFAICSNKENKKKSFDEYAVLSMTQTRAIGKAYRNIIGWVMKLAGYEGTPSEEMRKVGDEPKEPKTPLKTDSTAAQAMKKGQVIGPDGNPTYLCSETGDPISDQEFAYSMKMYGRPLGREAQKSAKRK